MTPTSPASLANHPPVLTLLGASQYSVYYGETYAACPTSGNPTIACDLGAIAIDPEDGDLTYRIRACPLGSAGGQSLYSLVRGKVPVLAS